MACVFARSVAQEVKTHTAKIEYPYKHYTIRDGLVQMQVQALYQDYKGYIWCGTKVGVSRFDGRNFKNYSSRDVKQNGPVVFFKEDKNNNLLIFNRNNVSKIVEDTAVVIHKFSENYYLENVLILSTHNRVTRIVNGKLGKQKNEILHFEKPDSLYFEKTDPKYGKIIYFDERNRKHIWKATLDSIYVIGLRNHEIIKTFINPGGIIYLKRIGDQLYGFSRSSGIYRLIDNKFEQIVNIKFSDHTYFRAIPTPDNKAFIFHSQKDIYYYKNELVIIKKNMTFIRDIMFDKEENLWVATEEGLYNFFQLNFANYTFGMGNKDWVWSILEDEEKNMWFSSYQNGIWKWNKEKITDYTKLFRSDFAFFMGASKSGTSLYFPTHRRILKYDKKKFSIVKGTNGDSYFITKTVSDGTLYGGGMLNLVEIKPDGQIRKWPIDILKTDILTIEAEKNNRIVVAGNKGMAIIRKDTIIHYNVQPFTANYCSTKDHKNNIWIGGNQVLNLLIGDTLINVLQKSPDFFLSMLFVEPHYLLMGCLNGLYVVNLHEYYNKNVFEPILYNQNNGFTGIECGQNGFFTDSEGYVWINTSDLVTRFDPKKLFNKKINPPYLNINTKISSDVINWQMLSHSKKHKLKHNLNNFKFQIDAISFANFGNIRYYYRLSGLQNNWSEASTSNEITIYNLKPGEYQLLVKADPGISSVMSESVTFDFEIEKPFWLTWWFLLCIFLLTVLFVIFIIWIFNRRVRKQELNKKRILQLRSDALKAQMNPHLIHNALNNINGLINLGRNSEAQDFLTAFSRMLRMVLESANKDDINLARELIILESFIQFHSHANVYCIDYQIINNLTVNVEDVLIPPMLLQPFVENSILHGIAPLKDRKGNILIEVKNDDNRLNVIIQDNGVGMDKSERKGTGLGNKLTRERLELLDKKTKNKVHIRKLAQGTKIMINIPLKLKHYEKY